MISWKAERVEAAGMMTKKVTPAVSAPGDTNPSDATESD